MTKHSGMFVNDPKDEEEANSTLTHCIAQKPGLSSVILALVADGNGPIEVINILDKSGIISIIREHYATSEEEERYFAEEYEQYLRETTE